MFLCQFVSLSTFFTFAISQLLRHDPEHLKVQKLGNGETCNIIEFNVEEVKLDVPGQTRG